MMTVTQLKGLQSNMIPGLRGQEHIEHGHRFIRCVHLLEYALRPPVGTSTVHVLSHGADVSSRVISLGLLSKVSHLLYINV